MAALSTRALVALPWLLRVRWVMIAGQAIIVSIAWLGLGIALPLAALATLIVATAVTNIAAYLLATRIPAVHLSGALLLCDVLQLTGLLSVTGGPLNPFSMMFLVYITLGSVVLDARWTWTVAVAAAAGFGVLFVTPPDEHSALAHAFAGELGGHLQGMWWAFAAAAALTATFVVRLSREIDQRDQELAATRERVGRTERLASLTTLAAGAAHELGTPLATIAVAAGELDRALAHDQPDVVEARVDVRLIQDQLTRARSILDRMARRAGDPPGEMPQRLSLDVVVGAALELVATDRGRIQVKLRPNLHVRAPLVSLSESIAGLIRNALDAGPDTVCVSGDEGDAITLEVRDTGRGMAPEVLARVGEPFFTTKGPGQGLGLGVFLARLLATDLGGDLSVASSPGVGTIVTMRLPAAD